MDLIRRESVQDGTDRWMHYVGMTANHPVPSQRHPHNGSSSFLLGQLSKD
jgi:hypothetical protein